jgi:hypothetical protein
MRVLDHTAQGVTAKHYNRHQYEVEKRDALTRWAKHIETLTSDKPRS